MKMSLESMSLEQWGNIFDHWYRHVFKIGMLGEGPPPELIEKYFSMGVSPAEAVAKLKEEGLGACCSG